MIVVIATQPSTARDCRVSSSALFKLARAGEVVCNGRGTCVGRYSG